MRRTSLVLSLASRAGQMWFSRDRVRAVARYVVYFRTPAKAAFAQLGDFGRSLWVSEIDEKNAMGSWDEGAG